MIVALTIHISNRYCTCMLAGILTEDNHLVLLQDVLWSARSKYSNLGLELGVKADTISAIERSNQYKVDECFKAVLQEALRSVPITKQKLVDALKSRPVGFGMLATEVSQMSLGKTAIATMYLLNRKA